MLKRKQADVLRLNNFRDALINAKESIEQLRRDLNELDLDKINEMNFFKVSLAEKYIRMVMAFEPKDRSPRDIEILVKSTGFLTFFQTIKIDDPNDEFHVHRQSCIRLTLRVSRKGEMICKHSSLK